MSAFIDPSSKYFFTNSLAANQKTALFELNLQTNPSQVIHRKDMSLAEPTYEFISLLSNENIPQEIILATEGTDRNRNRTVTVPKPPHFAALSPKYPWVLKSYGVSSRNGTLHRIATCNGKGIILTLINSW